MSLALDHLVFDNRFSRLLPADPSTANVPRQVRRAAFSRVRPRPTTAPSLVAHSPEVAELLGIDASVVASPDFAAVASGNRVPVGADPRADCYGGHQFGHWAGQLGDGRAISLGEVVDRDGRRQTLQLKGAGPTPYSRTADGLAVLRSSVREFLSSEAMFHLGVPTTRALSLVLTGDQVLRDMFYDGRPAFEPGAVVCRVAPSFTRFGNFEIFASRGEIDVLGQLVDYTIENDFPELDRSRPTVVGDWFEEVVRRTVAMVVDWMRVGFVHGVMNTDNLSILGLTIDYGPYGWLEDYDPDWTPNTTDAGQGRYRFGFQPRVAYWNLSRLAGAIAPVAGDPERLQAVLDTVPDRFETSLRAMTTSRLGLTEHAGAADDGLFGELLEVLRATETDMTIFFRSLADVPSRATDAEAMAVVGEAYYGEPEPEARARMAAWLRRYRDRVAGQGLPDAERREAMNRVNPRYVLRNYMAQEAIDLAETGDFGRIDELLDVLRRPYDDQPGREAFAARRPDWARSRPGCSMLSCSS